MSDLATIENIVADENENIQQPAPRWHVMLDLETLGTRPGSAILSIGACAFTRHGLGPHFYCNIDRPVGRIDADTVLWWMRQSEAARAALFRAPRQNHFDAIRAFYDWFKKSGTRHIWSNGAGFDEPMIRAANPNAPWSYKDVCCARTIYRITGITPARFLVPCEQHNALADAHAQALAVIEALNLIGWPEE